jgi:hypothetical protein
MGRRWLRRGLALTLLWGLGAVPARGQYRPPGPSPSPSPQEPATPTPTGPGVTPTEPVAAGPARQTAGWEPLIVVEGIYEQNVGFRIPPGPDAYFGSVQAFLTRWHRTSRSDVRFTMEGNGYLYPTLDGRNRADGAATLQISSQMTRRLEGTLDGRFSYGHSDTEDLLIDNAVLLPLVRTLSGNASGGLSWQLAERTTFSLDGGWQRVDFDSDVLIDTQLWRGAANLTRRISQREELSLFVQFIRVEDAFSARHEPSASLGFTSQLSKDVSLDLSAGAGRSETVSGVEAEPLSWTAQVTAGLTATVRRGYLSVRYEHGLQPLPGLGVTQLTDLFSLGAVLPVGRRLELLANGSFALRSNPQGGDSRRGREADAFAGGALRLARRLRLVLGYRFRYHDDPLQGMDIRNSRGSVSLAWGPQSLTQGP